MKTLLLDTNTLNYILKGREQVLDRLDDAIRNGSSFLLGSVVHFELTRYLRLKGARRMMRVYERLVSPWRRCDLTFEDWTAAAALWAERSRADRSLSDLDLLLTVLARREQAVLVTSNTRHFEGFGLPLENWDGPDLSRPP